MLRCREVWSNGILGLAALLLVACGGGGSSSSNLPPTPAAIASAPSGLSYSTPLTFTVNQAITNVSPTVTGSVASYAISPQLPAGLSLSTTSGVLSGTPTAITSQVNYTVTATNAGGSTTAQVAITVTDAKPAVAYSSGTVALAMGVAVARMVPKSTGGAVTSWSISPALPAGLTFDTTDGNITGTPTTASAAAVYTVTATNAGGQATFAFTLSVQSGTLLDLGHADNINLMRFDGAHVVSGDITGHWVLWVYATAATVASGDSDCTTTTCQHGFLADVAGPTVVIHKAAGFELRSATDGHVVTTIPSPFTVSSWTLATDGSYFSAQGTGGFSVWSSSGALLLTRSGDYSHASVYASPTEILIASPAAGDNVVETINVASMASTIGPQFNGTFQGWFADGGRFATSAANTVLIYSKASIQEEALAATSAYGVGGTGSWFWVGAGPSSINLYTVGGGTTPVATFQTLGGGIYTTATTLDLLGSDSVGTAGSRSLSVIDLSGATPTRTDFTLPVGGAGASVFAASSASHWVVGDQFGVVLDGAGLPATPRYFSYGQAWSIAGSPSLVAIATASGRILYFDSASLALQGTILDFSSKLQLSTDATVLAAQANTLLAQYNPDWSLNIYSLPSRTVLAHWPYPFVGPPPYPPVPQDIALSGSGTVLAQVLTDSRKVTGITPASNVIWTDTNGGVPPQVPPVRLSPDGTLIAAAVGNTANILNNGTLVTAVNGWPLGWLDNGHLIVNLYNPNPPHDGTSPYLGASILDAMGNALASSPIPELHEIQPLTAQTIYSPEFNTILSLSTGAVTWSSGYTPRGKGAVAGGYVIFASGTRVLALPH
jgi:hypothetical protein